MPKYLQEVIPLKDIVPSLSDKDSTDHFEASVVLPLPLGPKNANNSPSTHGKENAINTV